MLSMMAARPFRYLHQPNATGHNNCNDAYNYCVFTGVRPNERFAPAAIFGRNARINNDLGPPRWGQFGKLAAIVGNEWWTYDGATDGRSDRPTVVDVERIN